MFYQVHSLALSLPHTQTQTHPYLGIWGVKEPFWDLQPLSPKVTVVAIGQLIVHSGHLCSNPDIRERSNMLVSCWDKTDISAFQMMCTFTMHISIAVNYEISRDRLITTPHTLMFVWTQHSIFFFIKLKVCLKDYALHCSIPGPYGGSCWTGVQHSSTKWTCTYCSSYGESDTCSTDAWKSWITHCKQKRQVGRK